MGRKSSEEVEKLLSPLILLLIRGESESRSVRKEEKSSMDSRPEVESEEYPAERLVLELTTVDPLEESSKNSKS